MKTLRNTPDNGTTKNVKDVRFFGNPDAWRLICKASSESEGWMKSTKAMELPNGCLIQVTTQQGDNVAEAVTFVPDIRIYEYETGEGRRCAFAAGSPKYVN